MAKVIKNVSKSLNKGTPKKDGSGRGVRLNQGRGGCKNTKKIGQGKK